MQYCRWTQVQYDLMGPVFILLDQHAAHRKSEEYLADGSLQLAVTVKESCIDQLQTKLMDATSGRVYLRKQDGKT